MDHPSAYLPGYLPSYSVGNWESQPELRHFNQGTMRLSNTRGHCQGKIKKRPDFAPLRWLGLILNPLPKRQPPAPAHVGSGQYRPSGSYKCDWQRDCSRPTDQVPTNPQEYRGQNHAKALSRSPLSLPRALITFLARALLRPRRAEQWVPEGVYNWVRKSPILHVCSSVHLINTHVSTLLAEAPPSQSPAILLRLLRSTFLLAHHGYHSGLHR